MIATNISQHLNFGSHFKLIYVVLTLQKPIFRTCNA